jgi:SulP family sulfate permease
LKSYSGKQLASDIVAGIIVAIIALPLSIALAIASGVSPEQGLYTAIIAGFAIALFGGSRVNISGPTAAFATIVAGVVASHGVSGLVIATLLAGVMLILMGICHFGSLIKYIPVTITVGFTGGIAVTILVGQIKDFLGLTFASGTNAIETGEKLEAILHSIDTFNPYALLVGGIGLIILILWPILGCIKKLGKVAVVLGKIPPSIIAVVVGIVLVEFTPLKGQVNTIGSLYPTLSSAFPTPALPVFEFETIKAVLPSAFTIAILAAIESLLSCVVSDGMIGDRHNSNTELIAQGIGNVCSGLFGGIPATGAIARTAANVKNGGRSPIAGMVHAVVLALFLVVLMPLAKMIPMPIIAAILFMVAYNMSEWRHFVHICKTAPKSDILVLVLTFALTVIFDLVVAIAVGLVLAAVLFLKRMADVTTVRRWDNASDEVGMSIPAHTVVYEIHGPMFFADSDKFLHFDLPEDTRMLIVRMGGVPALDVSVMKPLEMLLEQCQQQNVTLLLAHVNPQPMSVLQKAGFVRRLGEEHFVANISVALSIAQQQNNDQA